MEAIDFILMLHVLGLAWGLGGVTVNVILMMKSEKNPEIAPAIMSVAPSVAKLIWLAIVLLVISGIGLAIEGQDVIDSTTLLAKHALVATMVIIGLILVFSFLPKMQKLAPKGGPPSPEFLGLKKKVQLLGTVNLVLWYAIFGISYVL
jgi:putative copper export protein